MTSTYRYHIAINGWMRGEGWMRGRGKTDDPPYGKTRTYDNGVIVRCEDVEHCYVVASSCRRNRPNWHNRIHHARARWIATDRNGVMELGQTYCSRTLVDPLYVDEPSRDCGCENGPALMCPGCEIAFHGTALGFVCAEVA